MNEHTDILVVDDMPQNVRMLSEMLTRKGYAVRTASSGAEALVEAEVHRPNIILMDINMPDMDGYETCKRLKENPELSNTPVLFLSALNDAEDKVKAFNAGGVDYVTKPFEFKEVIARVNTHLDLHKLQKEMKAHTTHLEELVTQKVQEISSAQRGMIFALAKLAESRDDDTGTHMERVRIVCKIVAESMQSHNGYSQIIDAHFVENIYHTSPLHDIGKVAIPDAILLKPGKLTPEEFDIMKTHTNLGAATLQSVHEQFPENAFVTMGIDIARSHHERWDGKGYPDGLQGESIPLSARIMTVADVYDALRSKRCYKDAFSHEKSHNIIIEGSGTQFAPSVVAAFERAEPEIVELYEKIQPD